jgi:uncharacterized protein (TIGR03435 family)
MRIARALALPLFLSASLPVVLAQTPAPGSGGPTFDVVSIKPNTGGIMVNPTQSQRPDGGFTLTNMPVGTLVARAYPPAVPADIVGFPDWARRDRWDFHATSSLTEATPEQRTAMLRSMLADRFKLVAHLEKRPRDVFELVLARSDGRLGSGLQPVETETDCLAQRAAAQAARDAGAPPPPPDVRRLPPLTPGGPPRFVANSPAPECTLRMISENMDGHGMISDLATMFRMATGREVVDKSGLTGFYRITMRYDPLASRRPPDVAVPDDAPPSLFTAVQEQLGMKLVAAKVDRDTLIIDRLERPTEN